MSRLARVAKLALLVGGVLSSAVMGQESASSSQGMTLYLHYCSQCHGEDGNGLGVAAPRLLPRPRDFTAAQYKVRSTPTGQLPTDADLAQVIREGLPYTAMPSFEWLTEEEVASLIEVIKGFSEEFQDPDRNPQPLDLPEPPGYDPERAATVGREVYERTGCASCHGELGRGAGSSAPTLVDARGFPIPPADLTMPWTFRGGGTRQDIYRTMATGFNGTPMPGFAGSLPEEEIWAITDYIASLAWHDPEEPYDALVKAVYSPEEIDLATEELFAEAPATLFPLIGQVTQPGREFTQAVVAIQAQAVYDDDSIAVRLVWHDMTAERSGNNSPSLPVETLPLVPQPETAPAAEGAAEAEATGGFWGTGVASPSPPASGEEGKGEGGSDSEPTNVTAFFTEPSASVPAAPTQERPYSDAVAIQIPRELVEGIARPYFLFGDLQHPVELWFADLAAEGATTLVARGSDAIEAVDAPSLQVVTSYGNGTWEVIFERPRKPATGVAFAEDTFVPIAFTVWDGRTGEHGNKRGLTRWFALYVAPSDEPSPLGPMLRAGLGVLGIELLIIGLARWYKRRRENQPAGG